MFPEHCSSCTCSDVAAGGGGATVKLRASNGITVVTLRASSGVMVTLEGLDIKRVVTLPGNAAGAKLALADVQTVAVQQAVLKRGRA